MPRYIDADKLINESKLDEFGCFDWSEVLAVITDEKLAPTEDVQPVVHAHWIKTEHKGYKCSLCNCLSSLFDENLKSVFCPWCGAKMDEKEEHYIRDIFMTR